MEIKVAANSLHWSQPSVSPSPAISSPSSKRRRRFRFLAGDRLPVSLTVRKLSRRSPVWTITKASASSCFDSFSDEEFSRNIRELASRFNQSDDLSVRNSTTEDFEKNRCVDDVKTFDALEPPGFHGEEIIPANIEWKANSVDIPLSLRIIKRKKQWQSGLTEAGESAYCSVKKAFSSMVFIIRELQSYTLQMREALFYEDLQGIMARVQKDMHASFVWLFQKVFSHTPTLMVYVMILLANYSVHSLSSSAAMVASPVAVEEVSTAEDSKQKFDSSVVRKLNLSSLSGKTTSVGGNSGGGGGKCRPVGNGTDGDGRFDELNYHPTVAPNDVSSSVRAGEESISKQEGEASLWGSVVEDASGLDQDSMQIFESPVDSSVEGKGLSEHLETEAQYETQLACDPKNPLLLANYAQFLYLVVKDYDRAEEYFKQATKEEPKDAEALNKYASFLWHVRDDLWAAEETYLEAISVEPNNSYYAASYAHFLWNTGGEDTCFPLDSPDVDSDETTDVQNL